MFFAGNQISSTTNQSFVGMESLSFLGLNQNKLSSIPDNAFAGLTFLVKLFLDNNLLSTVTQGMFAGLYNLHELTIHSNQISVIGEGSFDYLFSLRALKLEGNKLTSLDPNLFINLPRPLMIGLSSNGLGDSNKWNCRSLCWLRGEEFYVKMVWWPGRGISPEYACPDGGLWRTTNLECAVRNLGESSS